MQAPHIALILRRFGRGGTDRVCVHLANGFVRAGYATEIVSMARGGDAEDALLPLLDDRVGVAFLRGRSGVAGLADHLRARRPDCVVSTGNNVTWDTAAAFRRARAGGRLVIKTTNPLFRPEDGTLRRAYRRIAYGRAFRTASLVLTLSDAETAWLRATYPNLADRFRTVINPYVTSSMIRDRSTEESRSGVVLAVGRLERQKRMDLLVRAFATVRAPHARLVILGEGGRRPMLEALVAESGIADRVSLPGFVADAPSWFSRADVFVLPSRYEGLPAVVLEALAADCPVVATDCFAGARELLDGLEGCEVLSGDDPAEMARAIEAALGRPRPTTLTFLATRYCVDAAQNAHVEAIGELLAR